MPLINCKVELKIRWRNDCVLALAVVENDGILYKADPDSDSDLEKKQTLYQN